QAEDGIRDFHVTGVQTCALPIWELGGVRGPTGDEPPVSCQSLAALGPRAPLRLDEIVVGLGLPGLALKADRRFLHEPGGFFPGERGWSEGIGRCVWRVGDRGIGRCAWSDRGRAPGLVPEPCCAGAKSPAAPI